MFSRTIKIPGIHYEYRGFSNFWDELNRSNFAWRQFWHQRASNFLHSTVLNVSQKQENHINRQRCFFNELRFWWNGRSIIEICNQYWYNGHKLVALRQLMKRVTTFLLYYTSLPERYRNDTVFLHHTHSFYDDFMHVIFNSYKSVYCNPP